MSLCNQSLAICRNRCGWGLLLSVCHAEITTTVGTSFPSVAEKPPIPVVPYVIEH
jgi:hypothetical protein